MLKLTVSFVLKISVGNRKYKIIVLVVYIFTIVQKCWSDIINHYYDINSLQGDALWDILNSTKFSSVTGETTVETRRRGRYPQTKRTAVSCRNIINK